ncbi:MAG: putative DNA binding domain-containing protein [Planctomycetes bacterium]|nr:putative DNA binding domain-containing protein [Planctomycetota bacterium]
MNLDEIRQLVAAAESETVEFKKSTAQLKPAGETLCGFLNADGGVVLIGITNKGEILGQQVSDKTLTDVAATLGKFEPPPPIQIQRVIVKTDKEVIVLRATPAQESLPFTFDGRPYERVGTTTSIMPQERYQQLLIQRIQSRQRWENARAGAGIQDLDEEGILRTVRVGIEAGRLPEATGKDLEDILDRLGLRIDGEILNAAVVLFGRQFLPDYPQCQLRLARFKGTDKSEFLDQRQIQGHAFDLLDEAMLFLRRHLPVAGRIQPGLFEREDEPLFPLGALREALVNALCHRNYALVGGAVSVAVYDDRLEIWSDGTLPPGLSVEDLKRDHQSRPPNPIIADVFFRRGLVERWGRGTQKIVELCVKAGHPEPEFIEQSGAVGVRFLPSGYIAPVRVAHDLTERQREVLQILAAGPQMAFREIRSRMAEAPPDRTLREDLIHLKRLGIIGSKGHGRGAVWFLTKQGN